MSAVPKRMTPDERADRAEDRALEFARRLYRLREVALTLLNHDADENRQVLWQELHTDGSNG